MKRTGVSSQKRKPKNVLENGYADEATTENIKRFQELGYNVLILGKARTGKSYASQQYWATMNDKSKSIWTLAHANRYRYIREVDKLTNTQNIYDSSVFAAMNVDKRLTQKDIIFIDELGLMNHLDLKESSIVIDWLKENKCVMTADVHQPVNTKTLFLLLQSAFRYSKEVNSIERYNQYCLKEELKMKAYQINKFEEKNKFKIKILYASFDANRPLVKEFENKGIKSFVEDTNKIDIHGEISQGAKILTFSTETRDSLINDTITPDWINNLKVGDTLFCHTNERVSRNERRFWNGLSYVITEIEGREILLASTTLNDNNNFLCDRFAIHYFDIPLYFQPPYCICAVKGQGSDYKDVILYLTEKDLQGVYFQFLYLCATRARERFRIILENPDSLDLLLRKESFVRGLDNSELRTKTVILMEMISNWLKNETDNLQNMSSKEVWEKYIRWWNEPLSFTFENEKREENKNFSELEKPISYRYWNEIMDKMRIKFGKNVNTDNHNKKNLVGQILTAFTHKKADYIYRNAPFCAQIFQYFNIQSLTKDLLFEIFKNIDYRNEKVKKLPDIKEFMKFKVDNYWYISYYSLGKLFKKINPKLTPNDIFALITFRLALEENLTEEFVSKKNKYWLNMLNGIKEAGITETSKIKQTNNYTKSNEVVLSPKCFIDKGQNNPKCFINESEMPKYEGNISGRYSVVTKDGKTKSNKVGWLDKPLPKLLNCYNLYRTPYVVFDIDDMTDPKAIKLHNFLNSLGCPIYVKNKVSNDSVHVSGCHAYLRIDGYIPTKHYNSLKIDFLGNAKHQIVKLKADKYPTDFKVSDIEQNIPTISESQLAILLDRLNKLNEEN